MIKKKNKGWTFIFSLIPGAGEMYMGFMKRGLSIMALFWGMIAVATCLNIGPLTIVLPVIWCYSFFEVHNMNGMTDEEFYALEDDYVFHLGEESFRSRMNGSQNKIIAAILIVAGICILWSQLVDWMHQYIWAILPGRIANAIGAVFDTLPQIVIAILLIAVGIRLIKGKKKELEENEKEA